MSEPTPDPSALPPAAPETPAPAPAAEPAPPAKKRGSRLKWMILFVWLLGALVTFVVAPNIYAARRHGNESSAIGALKSIATAQSLFREGDKDGNGTLDYGSLAQLGATQLLDPDLATGTKQGYVFKVSPSAKTPDFLWWATAEPERPGVSGDRYFAINQGGVIFYTSACCIPIHPITCAISPIGLPVCRCGCGGHRALRMAMR